MKNIEITLGNKVRHILKKFNIKVPVTIIKHNSYNMEFGDDFDNSKVTVNIPDKYDINIPLKYSEKLWKVFNRFENKCEQKYDLMINIYFTKN